VGHQNGVAQWREEGFAEAAARGPVIASVSGRDAEDCALVCSLLPANLVSLVEVNVSCSHSGELFGRVDADLTRVASATRAAGDAFTRPPIVKLGWSPHVADVAEAAVEAGAGAIAVTNAIGPGLDIDVESAFPFLGITGGIGGLSGPAILPLALKTVAEVATRVAVPIVGIGGVSDWVGAAKMILVGASAVGIYTAAYLAGPSVFDEAHKGLHAWLVRQGAGELRQVRGAALEHLRARTRYEVMAPEVDPQRCLPCPACWRVCLSGAITLQPTAEIDPARCTGCGACIGACPPERAAISLPGRTGTPGFGAPRDPGRPCHQSRWIQVEKSPARAPNTVMNPGCHLSWPNTYLISAPDTESPHAATRNQPAVIRRRALITMIWAPRLTTGAEIAAV